MMSVNGMIKGFGYLFACALIVGEYIKVREFCMSFIATSRV
jgi:hypothetical protein